MKTKFIKIGDINLPEQIKFESGNFGRLMIYPENKKWKMQYVFYDNANKTFEIFYNNLFSFKTIDECAMSMLAGLKNNGYV